jgi:Holliday junction DNA helicase RuvB
MPKEVVLGGGPPEPPEDDDRDLRPQHMSDMVGQREVRERLAIAIDAANKRGEPLGHILFDGPPGLGKTTFARCIPNEMGARLEMANGAGLKAPKDLLPYLTNIGEGDVLFIDEIHRIQRAVEEYLYTAMEDFRIDIVLGEGISARTLNMPLKHFTLIGATTRAGMLSAPLRDRFQIREHLGFYSVEELTEIVQRNAAKLDVGIDDAAAVVIAGRSRDTPRVANNLLRWLRDYATSKCDGYIDTKVAEAALKMVKVDERGLGPQERRYLTTLIRVWGGGPAGIESIAHTMNIPVDTLSDEIEPFLLRIEMVVRTPRGRMVTAKAFNHLNMPPPEDDDAQGKLFE